MNEWMNPRKITKYGVVERLVYEAVSGYICNMDIYTAEGKKLENIISLLDRNEGHNHHSYQDKFYNNVRLFILVINQPDAQNFVLQ